MNAQVNLLSQNDQSSVNKEQEAALVIAELDPSVPLLLNTLSSLPDETASVRQAAAELQLIALAPGQSRHGQILPQKRLSIAFTRLQQALAALGSAVTRLDETNLARLHDMQRIRLLKTSFEAIALLLFMVALGYAERLNRQLRHEELARFGIESELVAERSTLERRVQARTFALEAEVRERQRAERLNRGRNHALEMLARNEPTKDILEVLVKTVAEFHSTWLCALHFLDGGALKLIAHSGLDDKLLQRLKSISADFADAPESTALALGRLHLIKDLGDEHKPWSELLRANGLQSIWSAPFFAPDSTALGTLTVYTLLKWTPAPADTELLEMACHMAALVLERRRLHTQLIDHAYHDSLTGLPNRRMGKDALAQATSRAGRAGRPMAVLWIDLDKFKQINDQYGHQVGDAVLQQVANRLAARIRASDTVARMGGDEFMAILEGTIDRQQAEKIASDLLDALAQPMQVGELELGITASIGISLYPEDGKTVDSLAQRADQAMYAAKFDGCGVRAFSPDIDREPAERRELEAELSHALEHGGFTMAYQPQCLPDGTLIGFEALLRFNSPRLGNVPPADFIPIAEEAQLIVPLGDWVLREVSRQIREWQDGGFPVVPVAVNISALQFVRDDFSDTVAEILAETGLSPALLVLELTESLVMSDFAESARQMKLLKRLGIRIAIDDFGTGYSSLSYLHRLPIDVLKIDRSFIEMLNEPDGTRPIVQAVLSMAHTLGLRVVAEGVETEQQLSTLCQHGCDLIQGYLFSRPVGPVDAAAFLRSGPLQPDQKPVAKVSQRESSVA